MLIELFLVFEVVFATIGVLLCYFLDRGNPILVNIARYGLIWMGSMTIVSYLLTINVMKLFSL